MTTRIDIRDITEKILGERIEPTAILRCKNENVYFFGNGVDVALHVIIDSCGGYKAINNPLSDGEVVRIGTLSEFQKSNRKGVLV